MIETENGLRLGMWLMPATRPRTPLGRVIDWNLEVIRRAEEYGYHEAWVGAHVTAVWEPIPSPQQVIARALADTDRILLGPGVEILYQQHPVTLAVHLAQLDHMAKGRLLFGFGSGATFTDYELFGIDEPTSREMAGEALDIIESCWKPGGPDTFHGKYWRIRRPTDHADGSQHYAGHGWHISPYAEASSRVALAGFSPRSASLRLAGERGYIPLSFGVRHDYLATQWATVSEGATSAGRAVDRRRWRVAKEIYVAETNNEARRGAVEGFTGVYWTNFFKKITDKRKMTETFRPFGADQVSEVTPEYLVDNGVWFVGDPDRVAAQIREFHATTGGFGTLLQLGMDYSDNPDGWLRSMKLLAQEVLPRLRDLTIPSPSLEDSRHAH
jgi:alkanesulfonate monooxygenase SsuD/methylene tetrahydromethanopterin reductase-like flavin-dependent oxidoreductase (luciferase family)